jgi:hypothetical protein
MSIFSKIHIDFKEDIDGGIEHFMVFQGIFMVKNFTIVKHEIALFKTKGLQIRTDVSINNGRHQPIIILKLFEQVQ